MEVLKARELGSGVLGDLGTSRLHASSPGPQGVKLGEKVVLLRVL